MLHLLRIYYPYISCITFASRVLWQKSRVSDLSADSKWPWHRRLRKQRSLTRGKFQRGLPIDTFSACSLITALVGQWLQVKSAGHGTRSTRLLKTEKSGVRTYQNNLRSAGSRHWHVWPKTIRQYQTNICRRRVEEHGRIACMLFHMRMKQRKCQ